MLYGISHLIFMSTLNGDVLLPVLQLKKVKLREKPKLSSSFKFAQLLRDDTRNSTPSFATDQETLKKCQNTLHQQHVRSLSRHTHMSNNLGILPSYPRLQTWEPLPTPGQCLSSKREQHKTRSKSKQLNWSEG